MKQVRSSRSRVQQWALTDCTCISSEVVMRKLLLCVAVGLAGCSSGQETGPPQARARLIDANGQPAGELSLYSLTEGTRVVGDLPNLPAGAHGFHFHATGSCQPPGFESAGAHFNPTNRQHGFRNSNGPHLGD